MATTRVVNTAADPVQVSGSFSATLSGFTPNGNVASLSVTSSSGNVALPAGTVVAVTNTGTTNTAYIKLSVGAGTAATTDMALVPGATVGLTVGSNTYINAITSTSTTTLRMAGGTGLLTGFGGGGSSSGGGGGAVTVADGADVTLGTTTDAKSTATDTTSVTLMQVAKQISASVQGATPAGSAIIGKVSLVDSGGTDATDTTKHAIKVSGVGEAQGADTSGQTLSPIGIRTLAASPTDTTAKTNLPVMDTKGAILVQPYGHNDNGISGLTSAMTGTTSTAVTGISAPGANIYNYITQLTVGNSHATVGTFVELQDGSGGTTFYTVPAAAVYGGAVITFPKPLKQPTANTALYCKNTTTGANVIVSASGFKGP